MDGTSAYDGRLEICLANVWGTICNHLWDRNDAIVACRQLGINATGEFLLPLLLSLPPPLFPPPTLNLNIV